MSKKSPLVLGLGEILWDMLPEGKKLGGAPTNFAYHCMLMGASSFVFSSVGNDELGNEILSLTDALGLENEYIQVANSFPSGTVSVSVDEGGHPDYTIHENVAWDHIKCSDAGLDLAAKADSICFGSLAQRNTVSRKTILKMLKSTRRSCIKVFDINLRQSYFSKEVIEESLRMANILKLNDDELVVISDLLNIKGSENEMLDNLVSKFSLDLVALTKGSKGSILLSGSNYSIYSSEPVSVTDSVGAGDSFTAALVIGLLNDYPLHTIHKTASDLAAYVCTKQGATPEVPPAIFNPILLTP